MHLENVNSGDCSRVRQIAMSLIITLRSDQNSPDVITWGNSIMSVGINFFSKNCVETNIYYSFPQYGFYMMKFQILVLVVREVTF